MSFDYNQAYYITTEMIPNIIVVVTFMSICVGLCVKFIKGL